MPGVQVSWCATTVQIRALAPRYQAAKELGKSSGRHTHKMTPTDGSNCERRTKGATYKESDDDQI